MKKLLFFLALAVAVFGQNVNVQKSNTTQGLVGSLVIPTGQSIRWNSGASAIFDTGSTVNLPVAAITWASVNKSGSSLADLATRSASDLSSGTVPLARLYTTAAGYGITNGAALDTIGANGSAFYLARANHTGTQLAATISDFAATASAAAPVQSVSARTGAVVLTKADVGLASVDNTADAAKPVSTAQSTAIATAQSTAISTASSDATTKANAAQAAAIAASQPLDADLTAIAALTTTSYGRSVLDRADAAALRTYAGLGTLATQSGTFSGTSSGTNTGDQTSVSGNAGTATALATARAINGVNFDGSAPITVTAAAGTLTGTTLASGVTASSLTSVGTLTALNVTGNGVFGFVNVAVAPYGLLTGDSGDFAVRISSTSHYFRILNEGGGNGRLYLTANNGSVAFIGQGGSPGFGIAFGNLVNDPVYIYQNNTAALTFAVTSQAATFAGTIITLSTTASTNTTSGSGVFGGGIGVAGAGFFGGALLSTSATGGIGYTTGAGGTVTQITSRTTGVTINKVVGSITLVSAAGTTSWQSFNVTNSSVGINDVIRVTQRSGTDLNQIHVTATAAGSFQITFATTGGITTEQPVFNFAVIKGSTN